MVRHLGCSLSGALLSRDDRLGCSGVVITGAGVGLGEGVSATPGLGVATLGCSGSALVTGGNGAGDTGGVSGAIGLGSGAGTGLSVVLKCLVNEYGVIFFKNFLFLSVNLPDPSTLTRYWS